MPSKKQRRRREKTFRHEYETVLLDSDGNEVAIDPEELRAEREAKQKERAGAKPAAGAAGKTKKQPARAARPIREPPLPSWRRAVKRGGAMGGLMLVAFIFVFKSGPLPQRLAIGLFYGLAFIPLTFWIDRTAYRTYQRRLAKAAEK
jgi:ferric-dicitrate binding protein FerR (iron transport regulator)